MYTTVGFVSKAYISSSQQAKRAEKVVFYFICIIISLFRIYISIFFNRTSDDYDCNSNSNNKNFSLWKKNSPLLIKRVRVRYTVFTSIWYDVCFSFCLTARVNVKNKSISARKLNCIGKNRQNTFCCCMDLISDKEIIY